MIDLTVAPRLSALPHPVKYVSDLLDSTKNRSRQIVIDTGSSYMYTEFFSLFLFGLL